MTEGIPQIFGWFSYTKIWVGCVKKVVPVPPIPYYLMYDRDGATEEQLEWVVKFDEIVERCKDYVMQLYDFERSQLDKIGGCMWWAKNGGIVDESRGPTLYSKIIAGKSGKRYDTKFREVKDLQDQEDAGVVITKEELVENCNVIAVIKIESIYICGENISLQVKVCEALVEKQEELPSFLRPVAIKANTEVAKFV